MLSGGGARGAYEAGIIAFLREVLPKRLGRQPHLDIITGTSVGAINACFLAATAHEPETQGARMREAWRSLRVEDMIGLRARDLARGALLLAGRFTPKPRPGQFRYGGVLETSGLERFVFRTIPWRHIHRNLTARRLSALAVSATSVRSGHTMVFVDTRGDIPVAWSRNPLVKRELVHVGPRHALASAAIPLLFPAVKIKGHYFTDGGLRQNTPLSPAVRLGADRVLVVSLRHRSAAQRAEERLAQAQLEAEREAAFPKPMYIAGKALNSLLLDHTEYDLDRMNRLNSIIEAGTRAFGPEFQKVLSDELVRIRGAPVRPIEAHQIRPSVDIGTISSEYMRQRRYHVTGALARRLMDRIAGGEAAHESDLVSYLLFDGGYCGELVELGYRDAMKQEDELLRLFADA